MVSRGMSSTCTVLLNATPAAAVVQRRDLPGRAFLSRNARTVNQENYNEEGFRWCESHHGRGRETSIEESVRTRIGRGLYPAPFSKRSCANHMSNSTGAGWLRDRVCRHRAVFLMSGWKSVFTHDPLRRAAGLQQLARACTLRRIIGQFQHYDVQRDLSISAVHRGQRQSGLCLLPGPGTLRSDSHRSFYRRVCVRQAVSYSKRRGQY